MNPKPTGWAALATLVLTSVWLAVIIVDMARAGPLDTYAQTLAHVSRLDAVYYAIYIAAGLLTATTAMLMAGLYGVHRQAAPAAALLQQMIHTAPGSACFPPFPAPVSLFSITAPHRHNFASQGVDSAHRAWYPEYSSEL